MREVQQQMKAQITAQFVSAEEQREKLGNSISDVVSKL